MSTLLQISTSIFSGNGQSTRLASRFVENWRAKNPGGRVLVRNFADEPIPHLTGERFQAFLTPAAERTSEQLAVVAQSDALIEELRQADVIVLALPMYNLGIASTLKAYFDHVARAGVTFRYTENGPKGLLADRKVYVITTRGGRYQGTPLDTQSDYVRNFLGFIGITDVEFVYAEGLNMGMEHQREALIGAQGRIEQLLA